MYNSRLLAALEAGRGEDGRRDASTRQAAPISVRRRRRDGRAVIHEDRVRVLGDASRRHGKYVLYWMQQSQRARHNPALEYAVRRGNDESRPVIVGFGLTDDYPDANARHYRFMLEGLGEVREQLAKRRISMVVRRGSPERVVLDLGKDAAAIVCDRGYLRHQRRWRERVASEARCPVIQVEGDVVVPVEKASGKAETAARTLRPKVTRLWDTYLQNLTESKPGKSSLRLGIDSDVDVTDVSATLEGLDVDREVRPVRRFVGGTTQARKRLTGFLRSRMEGYADRRNEPAEWHSSMLSPYLHFGQISPVEIALKVRTAESGTRKDRSAYLEELLVRRELAVNFVWYTSDYDAYGCLPEWARKTLRKHRDDPRDTVYTRKQLAASETHDRYWNAAMTEMRETGFMQNYMRMYWGKKILEWTRTPEYAYRTTRDLNNRYFLDGRDANSYANVAWCFGLHDRGWTERNVFGTVRYMNARGLERKFDIDRYVDEVERLVRIESEAGRDG